jgi:hypothetical protein
MNNTILRESKYAGSLKFAFITPSGSTIAFGTPFY